MYNVRVHTIITFYINSEYWFMFSTIFYDESQKQTGVKYISTIVSLKFLDVYIKMNLLCLQLAMTKKLVLS